MTKFWIIAAAVLIVAGIIIFVSALGSSGWDFSSLSTQNFVTNTYDISVDFENISINTDTADIVFFPAEGDKCKVICLEDEKATHTVKAENGILSIKIDDNRQWQDHIGIFFTTPQITVYLPKNEYSSLSANLVTGDVDVPSGFTFGNIELSATTGDIKCCASSAGDIRITTTTGDVRIEKVHAKNIALSLTTGDTQLTDIACESITSKGTTGDIVLNNVIADTEMSITRGTGDIKLNSCDGGEIFIKTTTGDVEGSLLSDKIFTAKSSVGDIDLPNTASGGKCEINVTTGDIHIRIK